MSADRKTIQKILSQLQAYPNGNFSQALQKMIGGQVGNSRTPDGDPALSEGIKAVTEALKALQKQLQEQITVNRTAARFGVRA